MTIIDRGEYIEYSEWGEIPSNLKSKTKLRKMHLIPNSEMEGMLENEEWTIELFDMIEATYYIPKTMPVIPAVALSLTKNNLMIALKVIRESKEKHQRSMRYIEIHNHRSIELEELERRVLEKLKFEEPEKIEKIRVVKDAVATLKAYTSAS